MIPSLVQQIQGVEGVEKKVRIDLQLRALNVQLLFGNFLFVDVDFQLFHLIHHIVEGLCNQLEF